MSQSSKRVRLNDSPLHAISLEEKKLYFERHMEELMYLVKECKDGQIKKEMEEEVLLSMKEKFTPLSCAKMEIDGKLPRSSLQNLRKVEPRIFPALHSFDKMKKYLIHAFEMQPEKTEKGWKLPIKQFISFLITKVYEVQPQDKIIFSFS